MRAVGEFTLCMTICLITGIVVFEWHMTLRLAAFYALVSVLYALVMETIVYGKVLR